jgi:HK97 family phage major capsid protein
MQFSTEMMNALVDVLTKDYGIASISAMDRAMSDLVKRSGERTASGRRTPEISKMIRAMVAQLGRTINEQTRDEDIAYVRALTTGSTPGSYLVPTIQANEIIAMLSIGGVARASGVRVWPMPDSEKLTVPASLASPTWEFLAQNAPQTPSDPNLGQLSFTLKERRSLVAVPNELLRVSVPGIDSLLTELLGLAAAEHEDSVFFASSTTSGDPGALMAASGITTLMVGDSADGGDLAFTDILAVLAKAYAVKARGPFAWYGSPRTIFQRLYGLVDDSKRPIFIPAFSGLAEPKFPGATVAPVGVLFGHPVYCTPAIAENESNGSGTNQSHLIFTNPSYAHIAQDGNIEMAISTERYFENNQTAIRAVQHEDFGYAPAAGIIVLEGIN